MSEWKEVRLGDVGKIITGKTPPKKVDDVLSELNDNNVMFITPSDMTNDLKYIKKTERYITDKGLEFVKNSLLLSESVCVSCIGSDLGKVYKNKEKAITNQQINSIIVNKNINSDYIYYYLKTYKTFFKQLAGGTATPILNKTTFSNIKINLPPLPTQKKIADILSVIDEKIETLQNINSTLEDMAKAIFKSWFVDFDITKAKASGKSDDEIAKEFGINKEIVQLFPIEFEISEIGEIPKGWEVVPFLDVVKLDTTSIKPFNFPQRIWKHYSIPAYDNNHYPIFEKGNNIKSNKYKVNSNAILVSKLNPNTERIWLPNINNDDFAICSTEFMQFIPYKKDYRFFIYLNILSDNFQSMLKSKVTGTTGSRQRVKPSQVLEIEIILPAFQLVKIFNKNIYPLLRMKLDNQEQIQTLQQTRDTLLPKLINGEIEVDELDIRGIE